MQIGHAQSNNNDGMLLAPLLHAERDMNKKLISRVFIFYTHITNYKRNCKLAGLDILFQVVWIG